MLKINSDNPAIEKNVRQMHKMITDMDGWIDPNVLITSEGGNLSIEMDGFADPRNPLMAVPEELLMPTEKMNISVEGDDLVMSPKDGALTKEQTEMGDVFLGLYNLTKKIPLNRESCCWLKYRGNMKPLNELLKARTITGQTKDLHAFATGTTSESLADIEAMTYVKTRTIGLKGVVGTENDDMQTYLMPIIDFVNHHPDGSNFGLSDNEKKTGKARFVSIMDARPVPNSNECYAYYNQMDTLDAFVNYGFPDSNANFVRSMPLNIDLGEAGSLAVQSASYGMIKQRLHKSVAGLRPYIPTTLRNDNEGIEVSHLAIPVTEDAPNALRRVLRMLISNRSARIFNTEQVWEYVVAAEKTIVESNIDFYKNLIAKAHKNIEKGEEGWDMILDIGNIQYNKLLKYQFEANYFEKEPVFEAPDKEKRSIKAA